MKLVVKSLTGVRINLDVHTSDTIDNVKTQIEQRIGMPADEQRLVFAGKQLEGGFTLAYYNIGNMATLHLVSTNRG